MTEAHPLQVYREARGFTQARLASLAGVSQAMISMILAGAARPSAESARRLYEAIEGEIPLKTLLYWPDVPLPELVERRSHSRSKRAA